MPTWVIALIALLGLNGGFVVVGYRLHAATRRRAVYAPVPPCHCGQPIPAGRTAYCSPACLHSDQDHGPEHDCDGGEAA